LDIPSFDDIQDYLGKHYEVRRVYIHPEFNNQTLFNDIALLTLKKEILFSEYVAPICLPDTTTNIKKVRFAFNILEAISYKCKIGLRYKGLIYIALNSF